MCHMLIHKVIQGEILLLKDILSHRDHVFLNILFLDISLSTNCKFPLVKEIDYILMMIQWKLYHL
ncbi:hypothetical protein C1646_686097 [Rhizophagus diaphanus]|nr:hypothetical protein C1646_686097 [Rhizophagus diaphanus] [Rhizophagus sp. MUCL 43196]